PFEKEVVSPSVMVIRRNLVDRFEAVEFAVDFPAHRNATDKRHDELRQSHVTLVGSDLTDRGDSKAELHLIDFKIGCLIFIPEKAMAPVGLKNFVEEIQVRGIAVPIQGLQ